MQPSPEFPLASTKNLFCKNKFLFKIDCKNDFLFKVDYKNKFLFKIIYKTNKILPLKF